MNKEQTKVLLAKIAQGVESQYPSDAARKPAMLNMFLEEVGILDHKLGRKIPPGGNNHVVRIGIQDLKKELEESLEGMEKNHGKMSLISILKSNGLFDLLKSDPKSVDPSQIKEALKKIKKEISDDDYDELQDQLGDAEKARKLVEELIEMDKNYYVQGKAIREKLEKFFEVYKSEAERLNARLGYLNARIRELDQQIKVISATIQQKTTQIAANNVQIAANTAQIQTNTTSIVAIQLQQSNIAARKASMPEDNLARFLRRMHVSEDVISGLEFQQAAQKIKERENKIILAGGDLNSDVKYKRLYTGMLPSDMSEEQKAKSMEDLEEELDKGLDLLDELEEKYGNLEAEKKGLEEKNKKLLEENGGLETENTGLARDIERLDQKMKAVEKEKAELLEEVDGIKEKIEHGNVENPEAVVPKWEQVTEPTIESPSFTKPKP